MSNYWNNDQHNEQHIDQHNAQPPTNYDDDQEESGEDGDAEKHVEEVVADDRVVLLNGLLPHKYELIFLRIEYCSISDPRDVWEPNY